ncbi:alpha/beta hydrolase [Luteibacter mycovicinus]|uniref:alpha/beta hydrolase n=1 Tax=Luteibacter mycovicinus TaxID=1500890 RepID=UPI0012E04C89|nr:alpha/beta hydrolase [Luteibacter sp. 9143a]
MPGPAGVWQNAVSRRRNHSRWLGVAIAQDAFDLMDALGIGAFHIVGHDWGGRATYHMAAMAPARLLSATVIAIGYSPRGRFTVPAYPQCARWWYQWFMTAEAGAQAVRNDPIGFARRQWDTWGPTAWITEDAFAVAAQAFSNRTGSRLLFTATSRAGKLRPMDPDYDAARAMVDATETLEVPMLFLQGGADECDPPEESEGLESYFSGGYRRQVLSGVVISLRVKPPWKWRISSVSTSAVTRTVDD